jgi:tRNA modification GTPase
MDTIVALSTPWGRSAIGLIRLSGPNARDLASRVCPAGPPWRARRASVRMAVDGLGHTLDELLVIWMPGPRSHTGEDVVELSGHGNPVILSSVIDALVIAGARPARPGEFTRRALENGRTNLLGAEALSALISAKSLAGARSAREGLNGGLENTSQELRESLLDMAAELEARLDHPDDDLSLASDEDVEKQLRLLATQATHTADSWASSQVRLEGAKVALIGPVNAGKSSLFNHLVGSARALVSDRPGTTRDVVERGVLIDGMDITFLDTAGEGGTDDQLEQAGVELGQTLSAASDLRVVVVPQDRPASDASGAILRRMEDAPHLVVGTFGDRPRHPDAPEASWTVDNVSGAYIEVVRDEIRKAVGSVSVHSQGAVVLSQRQHDLFRSVANHCHQSAMALSGALGPAVAVSEVIAAIERLGELEGIDAREAVLDRLFSRFCVGK